MLATLEKSLMFVGGGILLVAMMLQITFDVIGRYFFSTSMQGTMELTEFFMVAIFYFSLAHTQALKAHINVDLFLSLFSPVARGVLEVIGYFLGLMLFVLITWQGILSSAKAWAFWETTFGVIPFPLFPTKVLVPVGSFLLCLRFVVDIIQGLKTIRRGRLS